MSKMAVVKTVAPGKFIVAFTDRDGPFIPASFSDLMRLADEGYLVQGVGLVGTPFQIESTTSRLGAGDRDPGV